MGMFHPLNCLVVTRNLWLILLRKILLLNYYGNKLVLKRGKNDVDASSAIYDRRKRRHDDTQHDDTQHNGLNCDTQQQGTLIEREGSGRLTSLY
jgi:hypothetical protein